MAQTKIGDGISDIGALVPGKIFTIKGKIESIEPMREVRTKFGKLIRVANSKLKDKTGEIILSLWENDVDRVAIGDDVKVSDGWVSEFKGQLQITPGKQGKIEVL